jgi:hypothetical protein
MMYYSVTMRDIDVHDAAIVTAGRVRDILSVLIFLCEQVYLYLAVKYLESTFYLSSIRGFLPP